MATKIKNILDLVPQDSVLFSSWLVAQGILTPWWSKGIGTEAVRQICGIAYRDLALERIDGEVFPENLASARVLEKNGFLLERTKIGDVVKDGKAMDVKIFVHFGRKI